MEINGIPRQRAKLRHYHYDTWTFIPESRDDAVKKGMQNFMSLPLLLLKFVAAGNNGALDRLEWDLQGERCEGPAPGLARVTDPIIFKRLDI